MAAARGAAAIAARRAAAGAAGDDDALVERMQAGIGAASDSHRRIVVEQSPYRLPPGSRQDAAAMGDGSLSQRPSGLTMSELSPRSQEIQGPHKTFKELTDDSSDSFHGRLPAHLSQQGTPRGSAVARVLASSGLSSSSETTSQSSGGLQRSDSSSSHSSVEMRCTLLESSCPLCCSRGQATGRWLQARRFTRTLTNSVWFGNFILLCILANTVTLAMSNPLDTDSRQANVLERFEIAFTSIFIAELLLKWFALVSLASTPLRAFALPPAFVFTFFTHRACSSHMTLMRPQSDPISPRDGTGWTSSLLSFPCSILCPVSCFVRRFHPYSVYKSATCSNCLWIRILCRASSASAAASTLGSPLAWAEGYCSHAARLHSRPAQCPCFAHVLVSGVRDPRATIFPGGITPSMLR